MSRTEDKPADSSHRTAGFRGDLHHGVLAFLVRVSGHASTWTFFKGGAV